MQIVVLGAGVVGVTAVRYLADDGHAVTVAEGRRRHPASATSSPGETPEVSFSGLAA